MRLIFACLLASIAAVRAADVTFTSGPNHVTLIELFTSEGCSSCPPAERWLSERNGDSGLWKQFVPISWHVDYWNRLGWPDRFSTREFTQRQYDYVAGWSADSVYTPCFVRDGREWRPGRGGVAVEGRWPVGVLTLHYDGRVARGEFMPADPSWRGRAMELHVALLGGAIQSKVTAGENRGETLEHDFVALKIGAAPVGEEVVVPRQPHAGVGRYAIAAWVTRAGDSVPLQAVGGWLD